MAKIGYLHLSDLHIGDKYQKGLISQTKTILFDDIKYILSKIKKLDVVFFTGDFVQKGGIEEFEMLENFLHELWGIFEQNHQNPYLICVPGNHDLERMNDSFNPTQKVLLNWTNETELKKDYFWNNSNDYIKFVNERFRNYLNWYKATSIKKYNPQNEMFRLLRTKSSFSQNEKFFFSHPYPALFRLISHLIIQ